jgi:CRP-like cAMP-binding protein
MPCTTEALTDLTVCTLPRRNLLRLCEHTPQLALCLATRLATETISDWRLLCGLGTCSAVERIARLVLALYSRISSPGDIGQTEITLPISQGLIADATGLTAVHVCRMLKDMRNAGLLTFTRGHLHLIDLARLADMAQMGDIVPPQEPDGSSLPSSSHKACRPKPGQPERLFIQ